MTKKASPLKTLLSREWLGYLAFLVVFAVACGLLSQWQFSRREEAARQNDAIAANWEASPVDLQTVLPDSSSPLDATDTYQPVHIMGTYVQEGVLYVRNRVHDGQPGFEQLVPLRTDTGELFLVDRGWIASDSSGTSPENPPTPPVGDVDVIARLDAAESSLDRSSPAGQVASISLDDVSTALESEGVEGTLYSGAYGLVASETPSSATGALADPPTLDEGMHLSYAIQWIAFAVLAAVGFVYAFRTTRRHEREDAEETGTLESCDTGAGWSDRRADAQRTRYPGGRARPRRIDEDEAAEDAVLDALEKTPAMSRRTMRRGTDVTQD